MRIFHSTSVLAIAVACSLAASHVAHAGGGGFGCVGDISNDGTIDASDLALLLGQWNGNGSADLTGDGVIDAADLAVMLGGWGPCPTVSISSVTPASGGPGTPIVIEGNFLTNDPFQLCVTAKKLGGGGGGGGGGGAPFFQFIPIQVLGIGEGPNGQIMEAVIGPVADGLEGDVAIVIVPGIGNPVTIENPFGDLIALDDQGACWGDPQGPGANIIFNITGGPGPIGACGPGWDASHVGTVSNGQLCVTLPGGPNPNRSYPAGTKFEIWPRFHTCDGQYTKDFGTVKFTTNATLSPLTVAGMIETLVGIEIQSCGAMNGLIPTVTTTPLGGNNFQICIALPGHPVCAGNFVICVDW
jgi:hypothetical protein